MYGEKIDTVNKTIDKELLKRLNKYELKRIGLYIKVIAKRNKKLLIEVSDSVNKVIVTGNEVQKAISQEVSRDAIITKLSKLGNTPYEVENIIVDKDDNIFIPLKELNELRRSFVDKISHERIRIKKEFIINDNVLEDVNNDRVFKLKVNETQYRIEQSIKAENMIWDGSKAFSQAFLNDTRHMAPIPGVVNSSKITADIGSSISAQLGQTFLFDVNGPSVLFVRANESTYNTGSIISYKGDSLNLSVGSFSSSYNHEASGGAILSSNSIFLPRNAGSFIIGGAYYSNEAQAVNKITGGGFIEYTYKRLKLNAQIGQSKFSNTQNYDTSLYFIPEFKISDSLYLKTRFIRNVSQNNMQDEIVLTYKPIKNKNNLEIELYATNQYTNNSSINQRLKLSTSFKI